MKIALFGGSFNPVHKEHVNIVSSAMEELNLDKVIVIPTNLTPKKEGKLTASCEDRLNMCRLAFRGMKRVEVSDYEIKKGGISYSYLTCQEFKRRFPNDELYFIVGADMLENFPSWKNPEKILECVTLAVCAREKPLNTVSEYPYIQFSYVGKNVSSTRIRVLASVGEEINGYVPENVANYIKERSLYKIGELQSVKNYLSEKRWKHTVGVAVMAAENCTRFSISEEKAITAAILHDCAKYLALDDELLKGFILPEGVPETVIHQFTGAYIAEQVFGIKDEEILNAIKYHTTGKENMSPLEKLIYLSDILEEGRDYDGVNELRKEFYRDIDACMLTALERHVNYLQDSGKPIYSLTQRALNYFKENKK